MSAETDSNIKTVYIPLVNEGTDVLRPTQAVLIGNAVYRILPTPNYDPLDETWTFPPGSLVHCDTETRNGKELLVAKSLA